MRRARFAVVGIAALLALGWGAVTLLRADHELRVPAMGDPRDSTAVSESRQARSAGAESRTPSVVVTPFRDGDAESRTQADAPTNLVVLVIDAAGAPQAGVPVALLDRFDGDTKILERGVTGSDGTLRLRAVRRVVDRVGGASARHERRAVIALPLAEPSEAVIDENDATASPVSLVLPPTGRVTVRLARADGKAFTGAASVKLRRLGAGGEADLRMFEDLRTDGVAATATSGVATFARVGVGARVAIGVRPADAALRAVVQAAEGPTSPGDEARVDVVCGDRALIVTGRLIDTHGTPVAGGELRVAIPEAAATSTTDWGAGGPRWARPTPGADGRFLLRFEIDPARVGATKLRFDTAHAGPGGFSVVPDPSEVFFVDLPAAVRVGPVDLGDIVKPEAPVIAAGVVVNDKGEPVVGADVVIMRRNGREWESTADLWFHSGPTGPGGRFDFRGKVAGGGLGIYATSKGWCAGAPLPFEPGARDLVVTLTRAGALEGSFAGVGRGDTGSHPEPFALDVWLVGPPGGVWGGEIGPMPARGVLMVESGRFSSRRLPPGTYALEVIVAGEQKPALVVDGLVITAGETNRDARLQGIDVGKYLRTRTVTVTDEAGRPLEHVLIDAREHDAGTRRRWDFATDADGKAVVATVGAVVDLVLCLSGFRSVALPHVTGDVAVKLRRAERLRVTITLDKDSVVPEAPFYLGATLVWVGGVDAAIGAGSGQGDPRNRDAERARFGRDRTMTVTVPDPGVYAVQLSLTKETGGTSRLEWVGAGAHPAMVTVGDTGAATVSVTIDPAALAAVIKQFGGR